MSERLALPFGPAQVASGETDSSNPHTRYMSLMCDVYRLPLGVLLKIYFGGSTFSRQQSYPAPYVIGRGVFLYKFIFSMVHVFVSVGV